MENENKNNQTAENQNQQEPEFEETLENQNQSEEQSNQDDKGEQSSKDNKDVNKLISKEKRNARNAVFKELGIDPRDKKTIALIQNMTKGTKSENQEEKANSVDSQMQYKLFKAEAKVKAISMDVKKEYVEDLVVLAINKLDDMEIASDEDIEDAVEKLDSVFTELKTKYPAMFNDAGEEEKEDKKGQKGTGSNFNSSKTQKENKKTSLGERLAAQRRSQSQVKKSFWK